MDMKKILICLVIFIMISGCSFKKEEKKETPHEIQEEIPVVDSNKPSEIEKYTDSNPLKIALYQKGNGIYKKQEIFKSKLESFKDIGLFSVIFDDKDQVTGSSINSLYHAYSNNYEDISKYKIGYQISFTLEDGKEFKETILKPLNVFKYPFSDYLYIWLYDDINNTGSYSHLEENEYNDKTVMSSIKLMSTSLSKKINSDISVMVFSYDTDDDFDEDGYYRGVSKYEMLIQRSN